jgi:hypothetical protein
MYEFFVLIITNLHCNIVYLWYIHEPLQTISVTLTKYNSLHMAALYIPVAQGMFMQKFLKKRIVFMLM